MVTLNPRLLRALAAPSLPCVVIAAAVVIAAGCHPRGPADGGLRLPRAVLVERNAPTAGGPSPSPHRALLATMGLTVESCPPEAVADLEAAPGLVIMVPQAAAGLLTEAASARLATLVEAGALLLAEDAGELGARFGVRRGGAVAVSSVVELAHPQVPITWAKPAQATALVPPAGAEVLTVAKPGSEAIAVRVSRGQGHAIILAAPIDDEPAGQGFARFPYLPQAMLGAGFKPPFKSPRLWAFFDYGYRETADLEALAERWQKSGIAAVHVGAWDFWVPDPAKDEYLTRLLTAAHRRGILVYAWLELPHVSMATWEQHPEWREKTATLADAHLDWRYLMNLMNPDCHKAVKAELVQLLARFDWDGVNLSELYFESPMGPSEPAQMTPFNDEVRREYRATSGIDPLDLLRPDSPHFYEKDRAAWAAFVDYRVELEKRLNEQYLEILAGVRDEWKPDLGIALTYVDNLYDPSMREAVGADINAILPLLARFDITLVMEDPMTTWNLGPERYSILGQRYGKLTSRVDRLGIDINVVERQPPVYPTQTQTGSELLALLHHAGRSFPTVMVYAEQSILEHDLPLVAVGLAADITVERAPGGLAIASRYPVVVATTSTTASFTVDGQLWPAGTAGELLLPIGRHIVAATESTQTASAPHLTRLSGQLLTARYVDGQTIEITYEAPARTYAAFDRVAQGLTVDGAPRPISGNAILVLPRGRHAARVGFAATR